MLIIGIGTKSVVVKNIGYYWVPKKDSRMRTHGQTIHCRCLDRIITYERGQQRDQQKT